MKHARIGFESGDFWVEDLGSTHGTFVHGAQIAGRTTVPPGTPISLGQAVTIVGVTGADQLERSLFASSNGTQTAPAVAERRYPILVSVSEVVRPARLILQPGTILKIGRDPASDMWLGAPHVSRRHCEVTVTPLGEIRISDFSTNGTIYDDSVLRKGETLEVGLIPRVLDFGGGVTVGVCFNEDQEQAFVAAQGAPLVFQPGSHRPNRIQPGKGTAGRESDEAMARKPTTTTLGRMSDGLRRLFGGGSGNA
jgi:pSer/pThr/pTyr-binding forkhead associated (FHA) protein